MKKILAYTMRKSFMEKIKLLLTSEKMDVMEVLSVNALVEQLETEEVHLILVEIRMDSQNWSKEINMIADLRKISIAPMMVISEQFSEASVISILEAGADDFVKIGCSMFELLARIKGQINRYIQLNEKVF